MIRSALLLCAGLLVAACFACAQTPPPPPPAPFIQTATCADGSPFLSHVQLVQNGWQPNKATLADPPAGTGTPLGASSPYAQSLQNAFALAPPAFQKSLCDLTAIFVNGPAACPNFASCMGNSWGYRAAGGPTKRKTYIAISAGLWNQQCPNGFPYAYHCFESDLLNAVLNPNASPPPPSPPQYTAANSAADTFEMTILAALAHEVGHVRWYQAMNPGDPGGNGYNPGKFCNSNFFPQSWQTPIHEPPHWRPFKQRSTNLHRFSPQIADIDTDISKGDWTGALMLLEQLYQPAQPWASYFAGVSPDEDFVETYKFIVLTSAQAPLTSLPIVLAGVPHDIPRDFLAANKPLLSNKALCVKPEI